MNYASAELYPDNINKYIQEQVGFQAMLDPSDTKPFVQISPFMTREKLDLNSRRAIMDLSILKAFQIIMERSRTHTWVLIFRCIIYQLIPLYEL